MILAGSAGETTGGAYSGNRRGAETRREDTPKSQASTIPHCVDEKSRLLAVSPCFVIAFACLGVSAANNPDVVLTHACVRAGGFIHPQEGMQLLRPLQSPIRLVSWLNLLGNVSAGCPNYGELAGDLISGQYGTALRKSELDSDANGLLRVGKRVVATPPRVGVTSFCNDCRDKQHHVPGRPIDPA
jgi:hypothetical protein